MISDILGLYHFDWYLVLQIFVITDFFWGNKVWEPRSMSWILIWVFGPVSPGRLVSPRLHMHRPYLKNSELAGPWGGPGTVKKIFPGDSDTCSHSGWCWFHPTFFGSVISEHWFYILDSSSANLLYLLCHLHGARKSPWPAPTSLLISNSQPSPVWFGSQVLFCPFIPIATDLLQASTTAFNLHLTSLPPLSFWAFSIILVTDSIMSLGW